MPVTFNLGLLTAYKQLTGVRNRIIKRNKAETKFCFGQTLFDYKELNGDIFFSSLRCCLTD